MAIEEPDDLRLLIKSRLRELRRTSGSSGQELAEVAGRQSASSWYQWENDSEQSLPSLAAMVRLASHFGFSIDHFVRADGETAAYLVYQPFIDSRKAAHDAGDKVWEQPFAVAVLPQHKLLRSRAELDALDRELEAIRNGLERP